MEQEWFIIPGFGGRYEINKNGFVRSTSLCRGAKRSHDRILKFKKIAANGYLTITLGNNVLRKKQRPYSLHRLLAITFIPNPNNKPCINHINSNRLDNRIENLEWSSYSENNKHAYKSGFKIKTFGESHHTTKLTEALVIEIRSKYNNEKISMKRLGLEYNVSTGAIQGVVEKRTWKHI